MRTTVVQSVEISTLKTSADLPIQIRIRRSTSGQAVRLRNAIASPSQTSAVERRRWRASTKSVTRAPIAICHHEHIDLNDLSSWPYARYERICRQPHIPY